MAEKMSDWQPVSPPDRVTLEGRYVRLEPLDPLAHGDGLFEISTLADAGERMRWLFESPPSGRDAFEAWLDKSSTSTDPLFFAVIDKKDGKVKGRQSLMRVDANHGVIEIGNIYWGPEMARSPLSTEALSLMAGYVFDRLGYRRFEWKCNDRNIPSRRSARRFGFDFEGIFRQHMVVKGENRDTAWYAMLDKDWPVIRAAFDQWLDEANFDADGRQIKRLEEFRLEKDAPKA